MSNKTAINFITPAAKASVNRRTISQSTQNPKGVGLSIADEHSTPFVGTVKGVTVRAGRKVGQLDRP